MSTPDDILIEVRKRIVDEFGFKPASEGKWFQGGKCPACGKKELFTSYDAPWVLRCGRANRCGREVDVNDHYRDLFESWSKRYPKTPENPTASADAYLHSKRGLNLLHMRSAYTQELYQDRSGNISATVRFQIPNACWWERLIDQESRFDRKAHFQYRGEYQGWVWHRPGQTYEDMARADRLFIAEGIFDAWALGDEGHMAVSAMSTNNYPKDFLHKLRQTCAALGVVGPELVWAFDIGKAGTEYTIKYHKRALEEGWRSTAAQPRAEGETSKLDWNDLKKRGQLTAENLKTYLWHGQVLLAETATEKAFLLWQKNKWASFHFTFQNRTYWASFSAEAIAEAVKTEGVTEEFAAERCSSVTEIATCAFRLLYIEKFEPTRETYFYARVELPDRDKVFREKFTSAALTAAGEFKKCLFSVNGAQWLGSTYQLDRIMTSQTRALPTVETIDFTGYSREHKAWILGDLAVHKGKVYRANEDDYFDFGHAQLKLRSSERILDIDYDADKVDLSWLSPFWTTFKCNGLVTLTFWSMSFFAEQIRKGEVKQKSLGFLEMSGKPGTGKTTLIEFLWKLSGRESYEGFDPSTSTAAATARNLVKVANLPVVLMEGDRDEKKPHVKSYNFDETKKLYDGRPVRERGVATNGNETYAPEFRGALIIEQNNAVQAQPAVLERIMHINFTKDGWSHETKVAADRISTWSFEDISDFMVHFICQEKLWTEAYMKAFPDWERRMDAGPVRNTRIRKVHSQLHAGLDALTAVLSELASRGLKPNEPRAFGLAPDVVKQVHAFIDTMAETRDQALDADHEVVSKFWEAYEFLAERHYGTDPINLHRDPEKYIAVNLMQFMAKCNAERIPAPDLDQLKKHLRTSKSRPFIADKTVNTHNDKRMHCWVFAQSSEKEAA